MNKILQHRAALDQIVFARSSFVFKNLLKAIISSYDNQF